MLRTHPSIWHLHLAMGQGTDEEDGSADVGPICPECGQPCDVIEVDVGNGAYEFWGQTGVDVHYVPGSSCCHEPLDLEDDQGGDNSLGSLHPSS